MKRGPGSPTESTDGLSPLYDDVGYESEMDTTLTSRLPTPAPPPPDNTLARIVVLAGDQVGRTYVIGSETTIGRVPEVTIQLNDARVSRHHAVLRPRSGGGYEIVDLGSRNGTTVNGVPVTRQPLGYGDRIQVGTHSLLFTHHDPVQEQVLQRQKLEAVGQLAGGIAHDFNNLLGAGIATIDYIHALPEERTIGDEEVKECLADLRAALRRGEELTQRLLGFQRRGRAEHGTVDVTALCEEVVGLARRTLSRSIELRHEVRPGLAVHGHQGELHQVLMNLLINARDAMPYGGLITLTAELSSRSGAGSPGQLTGSPQVVVTVSDTGPGMDAEVRAHIFEPFFTTKSGTAGTGLGLSTVRELVTAHGGTVSVESEVGRGTTFSVTIPAHVRVSANARVKRDDVFMTIDATVARVGRILVVDDEELVRRSLGRLLRHDGHTVVEARDGEEALRLFEQPGVAPDLVILDIEMPGLDGVATLSRLRALSPTIGVLCVTGRNDRYVAEKLSALGILGVLWKPFETRELRLAVSLGLQRRAKP